MSANQRDGIAGTLGLVEILPRIFILINLYPGCIGMASQSLHVLLAFGGRKWREKNPCCETPSKDWS